MQNNNNKGKFMEVLDANIEAFMLRGYDRKQAIGIFKIYK
jgi:hypothetical protein